MNISSTYKALVFDLFGVLFDFQIDQSIVLIPEGVQLLEQYREYTLTHAPHIKLYVLSNASDTMLSYLRATYPDVFKSFVGFTTSQSAGARKPAPEIFEYFLNEHTLQAHECIFIDDMYENIHAARNLGFTGIHHITPQETKRQLALLNLIRPLN